MRFVGGLFCGCYILSVFSSGNNVANLAIVFAMPPPLESLPSVASDGLATLAMWWWGGRLVEGNIVEAYNNYAWYKDSG